MKDEGGSGEGMGKGFVFCVRYRLSMISVRLFRAFYYIMTQLDEEDLGIVYGGRGV
jgi:hypothetical protein